jgi:hypothetical protein
MNRYRCEIESVLADDGYHYYFNSAMENSHSHQTVDTNGLFDDCLTCLKIRAGTSPSDDGIFVHENTEEFFEIYWKTYDDFVQHGLVDGSAAQFDNTKVLEVTRGRYLAVVTKNSITTQKY